MIFLAAACQGLHVQSNSFARYGMKQHQRQLLKQNTQTQTIFAQHRPGTLRLRGGEEPGEAEVVPVDWQAVIGSLLGGLSLFLYSMKKLGDGIRGACGPQLKDMLRLLSDNRFMGFLTGMFVCALTNSLSLIAVLLVGFVGADLVKMENCLSILLGACVGSTFISYLVVFKVTQYGLLFIFGGYCITFFSSALRTQKIGDSIFGLGLIFYSMELMSSAFSFVKEHDGFLYILSRMTNPWLGFLVSTLFTGLIQSSGATMSILLSLSRQGMIDIQSCTGLMLGANVGTCVTGLLASIGQSREALRLAVALILVRIVASVAILPVHSFFKAGVAAICGVDAESKDAKDITMFLAASHTVFNVVLSAAALPFTKQWAQIIRIIIPDAKVHRPGRLTAGAKAHESSSKAKRDKWKKSKSFAH